MNRLRFEKIGAFHDSCIWPSFQSRGTHQHCWAWLAWPPASLSMVANRSTTGQSAWLGSVIALPARAFWVRTSLCSLHKFGICCQDLVFIGLSCHAQRSGLLDTWSVRHCIQCPRLVWRNDPDRGRSSSLRSKLLPSALAALVAFEYLSLCLSVVHPSTTVSMWSRTRARGRCRAG